VKGDQWRAFLQEYDLKKGQDIRFHGEAKARRGGLR